MKWTKVRAGVYRSGKYEIRQAYWRASKDGWMITTDDDAWHDSNRTLEGAKRRVEEREIALAKAKPVVDWQAKFKVCRVCGKNVDADTLASALRRLEVPVCSPECRTLETKRVYACCEKAEFTPCVCLYSFQCHEHGERHIGTHD